MLATQNIPFFCANLAGPPPAAAPHSPAILFPTAKIRGTEPHRHLEEPPTVSKAPRKPDAAATKPAPKRKQNPKASRKIKDPVERSETYVANTAATHGQAISAAKQRIGRLRELIEPETEAMVNVMMDIAKDKTVHASIRLEAADRVLSRAYGKPKEHVEVSDAADGAAATDEVMTLLGNIFEAVGLPPLLEGKGVSPQSTES